MAAKIALVVVIGFVSLLALGVFWSSEPAPFNVNDNLLKYNIDANSAPIGAATTTTLIELSTVLIDKRGGFLSNDAGFPGIWLDNMPNWEFGVLVQIRDLSRAMRKDFSRSQSQSIEDSDLAIAEPQFNFDNSSWMFPASESEYRNGIVALKSYLSRLNADNGEATFYARADNLRNWLANVETRLGSLSQRLAASISSRRINTDLTDKEIASTQKDAVIEVIVRTPWRQVDDVFYESRGAAWALIHILSAIEVDFNDTLLNKSALISLKQIKRELEGTQLPIGSPIILNGSGYGVFANHSLVMASYIARANAAIIDLRELLTRG